SCVNCSTRQVSTWSSCTMALVMMWTGSGFTTQQILTMPRLSGRATWAINKIRNCCVISQLEKYGYSTEMILLPNCLPIPPVSQPSDRIMAHREANPCPRTVVGGLFMDPLLHRPVHSRPARSERTDQRNGLPTLLHSGEYRSPKTRRLTLRHTSAGRSLAKTGA